MAWEADAGRPSEDQGSDLVLLAFDMFGTLADTASVTKELAPACADRAGDVALAWRGKQLEYMFRVTAMGQFPPFADLTQWSLAAALAESGFSLPESELGRLAIAYRRLRPFADARPALAALRARGHVIVVFSVGPRTWLEDLADSYRELVDDIVSAEDAGVYKPHPGIYRHLLARMKAEPSAALLVSSNPFDIAGAAAVGLRTAWCRRQPSALFDPWGPRPNHVITGLADLAGLLPAAGRIEERDRWH
jgi:2-haloacid dehalogenase